MSPRGDDGAVHVGPYVLEGFLGAGGMATVHRARAPNGRLVALKRLGGRLTEAEDRRRFEREGAIRLSHPNIVEVIDSGIDVDATPYIVLELLEGEELDARLKRGRLSAAETVDVGTQIARGLEAAHAEGIVHRDLKPSNIWLCSDGTVKVLDFGVALLEKRQTRFTGTGKVVGTPWYLAPEQARGENVLDARLDVWALGAVLYQCLSGVTPFDRSSALATVIAILREEPEPLTKLLPDLSPELGGIVARCLVKPRELRWQSMAVVRAALESVRGLATGTPSEPLPPPPVAHGEDRLVAVMLAEGAQDREKLRAAIEDAGGTCVSLYGHRVVGLFGGDATEGDELERAAAAAMAADGAARHISVAAGRATSIPGGVSGAVIQAAEDACRAKVSGIAIDARSARGLTGKFDLEAVSQSLYRLVREKPSSPVPPRRSSLAPGMMRESLLPPSDAAASSGATLFGRGAELAQLRGAVDALLEEWRARAVLVVGPPGIGKSRLRRELETMLASAVRPVRTFTTRADPLGKASALAVLAGALRRRARIGTLEHDWPSIEPDAGPERRRAGVRALVAEAVDDAQLLEETSLFVGELLGVDMGESPQLTAARGDPRLMADRLRVAVRDYFAGLATKQPVALVVEDLQWADKASLSLLEDLVDGLSDSPFFAFATARPWFEEERGAQFWAAQGALRVEPRALVASEVGALAASIAGRAIPQALVAALTERTAGNPLFVEQIVVELAERGELDRSPERLPLPVTVEAAIQSRLDHLPALEKNACKAAAAFGRPFSAVELEAIGTVDAEGVLESLRKRRIITARSLARGSARGKEYRFQSTLFSDVAYHMLADDPRREVHRRIANVLTQSPSPDDEEVATHFERGGELKDAVARYVSATLGASRRGDSECVLRCSTRALEIGLPPDHRYDVHMARADAMQFLAQYDAQGRELARAEFYAADDEQRARVFSERLIGQWRVGKVDDALAAAEAAIGLARAIGSASQDVLAIALGRKALLLAYGGALAEAEAALEESELLASALGGRVASLVALYRAQVLAGRGKLERLHAYRDAAALLREAGDLRRVANCESAIADLYNRFGAYELAASQLVGVRETCRRVGERSGEGYALANRAYSLIALGRFDEAVASLGEARMLADAMKDVRLATLVTLYSARAAVASGDGERALSEAKKAVEMARHNRLPTYRATGATLAARAALATGDLSEAWSYAEHAVALAREMNGTEEDEAEIFLVACQCLRALGRASEASTVRAEGAQRLRAREADVPPDLRASFQAIPAHRELLSE